MRAARMTAIGAPWANGRPGDMKRARYDALMTERGTHRGPGENGPDATVDIGSPMTPWDRLFAGRQDASRPMR
jgi:hypothetical protein